jgi:hypothetical protein
VTATLTSSETILSTPQYVLLDINRRIGPKLEPSDSKTPTTAIYGFTNKPLYDAFRLNTKQPLIPYPLVKRYLTKMIEEAGDSLSLIVLDANGPDQSMLQAAAIADVLAAHVKGEKNIASSHQLILNAATSSYRVTPVA